MERFIVVAAIAFAIVAAAGAVLGGSHWAEPRGISISMDGDWSGDGPVPFTADAPGAPPPPGQVTPYAAQGLSLTGAVARLTVIPEARSDVAVTVTPGASNLPPLRARIEDARLVLDGGLGRRVDRCEHEGDIGSDGAQTRFRARVRGLGWIEGEQMPRVTVRVPQDVDVDIAGAVLADIAASEALVVNFRGCGAAELAAVAGEAEINSEGSGAVRLAQAGALELSLTGSADAIVGDVAGRAEVNLAGGGDVRIGAVSGPLRVSVAGSGEADIAAARGPLEVAIAGSGDVDIAGGRPDPVSVSIAGSGGLRIAGAVGDLEAAIMGSGDVSVGRVEGRMERSVVGSGDVRIEEG